jgi:hypothetical protein
MLDRVRREARLRLKARVSSHNHFPTAAGLASSASGFAALAAAASAAAGLRSNPRRLSALARASSASAARSIYGGFVELPAGSRGDADLALDPSRPRSIGSFAWSSRSPSLARRKWARPRGWSARARRHPTTRRGWNKRRSGAERSNAL